MTIRFPGLVMMAAIGCACGGGDDGGGPGADGGGNPGDDGGRADATGDSEYDMVVGWIEDWHAAHPGKDGDINSKSEEEIAGDPDLGRLVDLCGDHSEVRPVIPLLAWEYGGGDHPWINPEQSALVYCDYIPVSPSTENWAYDGGADHVTAHVYVLFPEHNPCRDQVGAETVAGCIGDPTNFEILVDTASLDDGAGAGLNLAEASTELRLIMPDGERVHLHDDI